MADGISYIVIESISKLLKVIDAKNFDIINNIFNETITCLININFDDKIERQKFSKLLGDLIKWWDCLSINICCDESYSITDDHISCGKRILYDVKKYITSSSWEVSVDDKEEEEVNYGGVITDMIVYSLPMLEKTPNSDEFCSLMKNLMNRQVEVFKPNFEIVEGESDDGFEEEKCEEESETRKEQHGSKTTEEEITKTPDGREIRSTKTRIVNSSRTSKNITVRTFGNGQDNVRKNFFDVNRSHHEDSDEEFFETFKKPTFGKRSTFRDNGNSFFNDKKPLMFDEIGSNKFLSNHSLGKLDDNPILDDSKNFSDIGESQSSELQKIKKVDHSSATLQVVEKTKKTNGKLKFNATAHKLDTKQLTAQQKEIYDGDELIRKEGDGCFEENTTIGTGDINPEALLNLGTVNRFGLHNSKEFECGNYDNNGSYIKGLSMTSYLVVNESINNHEEQFRKRLQFEFRNNSPSKVEENEENNNNNKIDLNQLLELSDFNEMDKEVEKKLNDIAMFKEFDNGKHNILSLEEDLSLFEICDVKNYLVFVTKIDNDGKRSEICRGGPKNALIVYATQNDASLLYKEAFLTTYRTFISSLDVIRYLLYRFQYMINNDTTKQNSNAHSTISVIIRIIQNLSITELDEKILNLLKELYITLYNNCEVQFLKILRKIIFTNIITFHKLKNNNILPKQVHCMLNGQRVKEFLNLRSMKIAQEITIISSKLFHNVKEIELLWWSIDQSNSHSINLRRLTNNFNFISYWCRSLILMCNEQKIREKVFNKFLKISKYLRQFGDLNSYLAIIAALDCGPVNRLPWNKTINDGMKEHRLVMSSSYSFKNYRQLFSQCKPPCIPYIGLILQDLTFIFNGTVQKLSDKEHNGINYINFVKCFKQFTILESIRKLKMWDYSFETCEEYKNFLNNFVEHYSEEECWVRSEMIKPRQSKY